MVCVSSSSTICNSPLDIKNQTQHSLMTISPNPVLSDINIFLKPNEIYQIIITSILGHCFFNETVSASVRLDISNFPSGIYNVLVKSATEVENKKIIKN